MSMRRWRRVAALSATLFAAVGLVVLLGELPSVAAGVLLYPARRPILRPRPAGCADVALRGEGVTLKGWQCKATGPVRGTIVCLHGVADNRGGAAGIIERFTPLGFDVLAYDSRAHGESEGRICTYGYMEKADLRRVLDTVAHRPILLFGTSLGAAVALQEAAEDDRIAGIVAAEVFSDLRTVARERASPFLTASMIRRAFEIAEDRGRFPIDAVSPVHAAAHIRVPVLLIHGSLDHDTPPDHSRRVFDALAGPKQLLLVPGAGHNQSLRSGDVWQKIEAWVEGLVRGTAAS